MRSSTSTLTQPPEAFAQLMQWCRHVSSSMGMTALEDAVRAMPFTLGKTILDDDVETLTMNPTKLSVSQLVHACTVLGVSKSGGVRKSARVRLPERLHQITDSLCAGAKASLIKSIFDRESSQRALRLALQAATPRRVYLQA